MAQNEWKPLRRRAGLNSGVLDARVRVRCPRLPGHPPASVPRYPHIPSPSPRVSAYSRSSERALRGGAWAEMAPRKGRGLALPTSQGGARREKAACPGISLLEAGGVREMPSPRFPFPPLFILTVTLISSPVR